MNILEDLEWRGLVHQNTDRDGLEQRLNEGPIVLYSGFDPTADSLHIGNLLPILCLRRFQLAGHIPLALVGGGTGLIGDPSGRTAERTLNEADTVDRWVNRIKEQLSRFLDFESAGENAAQIVNNYDWLSPLHVIEFLRDIGKNFTVNYMLAKDSVDSRMSKGISFTEFSYMILQAYDFLRLHKEVNCELQIGGSDQWGNITAGSELIGRTTADSRVFGLTIPLITKADGTKFGKTAEGTIWLDATKTTPYQFYQFWYNSDDRDVIRFLKYFTFLTPEQIARLEQEVAERPEQREAHQVLAREVTALVHGQDAVDSAIRISRALFDGELSALTVAEIEEAFQDVPSVTIEVGMAGLKDMDGAVGTNMVTGVAETISSDGQSGIGLIDLLTTVKAATSRRQAREDTANGAIAVNGERITDIDHVLTVADRIGGRYIVVRRGKRNYFLAKFT